MQDYLRAMALSPRLWKAGKYSPRLEDTDKKTVLASSIGAATVKLAWKYRVPLVVTNRVQVIPYEPFTPEIHPMSEDAFCLRHAHIRELFPEQWLLIKAMANEAARAKGSTLTWRGPHQPNWFVVNAKATDTTLSTVANNDTKGRQS